ncbi:MAG TPA: hypothetical protein VFY39_13625 [Gammaproteobacteria bacterium]|nr:hypothetical protein [Gammaproteobacteria bacterium]
MKSLALTLTSLSLLAIYADGARADQRVIDFDTMSGVDGPFLSNTNPIRGVPGGGLPWVVDRARGRLTADGGLDVEVRGLVIPANLGFGFNPAPFFKLVVSCLSPGDGQVSVVNVTTNNGAEVMMGDPQDGDAHFKTHVDLPSRCVAPIVFVTSPGGAWFAATGG